MRLHRLFNFMNYTRLLYECAIRAFFFQMEKKTLFQIHIAKWSNLRNKGFFSQQNHLNCTQCHVYKDSKVWDESARRCPRPGQGWDKRTMRDCSKLDALFCVSASWNSCTSCVLNTMFWTMFESYSLKSDLKAMSNKTCSTLRAELRNFVFTV